jgi:hypothetical protein
MRDCNETVAPLLLLIGVNYIDRTLPHAKIYHSVASFRILILNGFPRR